jgi:hypothetical protein
MLLRLAYCRLFASLIVAYWLGYLWLIGQAYLPGSSLLIAGFLQWLQRLQWGVTFSQVVWLIGY